jgi:hypothetical protein
MTPRRKPTSEKVPQRYDRRVHVALPVRVTFWDAEKRPRVEIACTYDISARGARLGGLRAPRLGEVIAIERGRNRTLCRVIWIGAGESGVKDQVGVRCVESEKLLWEPELREVAELFDPLLREGPLVRSGGGQTQRRAVRYECAGEAEVWRYGPGDDYADLKFPGRVCNLSEVGCRLKTVSTVPVGAQVQVILSLPNYELGMRGIVRTSSPDQGMGIEFRSIRKGDRRLLHHLLQQMEMQRPAAEPEPAEPTPSSIVPA